MYTKNQNDNYKNQPAFLLFFIILLLTLLFLSTKIFPQVVCDLSLHSTFPPTPYTNAYLKFDGKGDFLRTNDINELEFDSAWTNTVVVETAFKITKSFSPQYIFGKYYGSGWILGYHTSESGYVSIAFNNVWKRVYYLGNDTAWHSYKISYTKNDRTLKTYVDETLVYSYTDFAYGNLSNGAAFSVGNAGFLPQYGNQTVNLYNNWLNGVVDYVKININSINIVKYDFNEHAGQFAKDSASYYINDRTLPGEINCGSRHFMLGYNPSEDTCDPEWILDENSTQTDFAALGSGLRYVMSENGFESIVPSSATGMTVWNSYLVACGSFNRAGETNVKNIAKWNGQQWSSIGNGFNYEPNQVLAAGGYLYATGYFDTAIGFGETRHIAMWNGQRWDALGDGLNDAGITMALFNGELIVGGYFMSSGGIYSPRIARWDGNEWHAMSWGMTGPVFSICVFNGELYAGGDFDYAGETICNGIAKWTGTTWLPVGIGISGGDRTIRSLKVYNGELYAGGSFISMNGTYCLNMAKFDGISWASVNGGASGYYCSGSMGCITDMQVFNNELYAIGLFSKIGGISANKIAKWNGIDWCSVEYGIDLTPRDLEIYNSSLIVNGDLYSISGNSYNNIAAYTPEVFTGVNNQQIPGKFTLNQNYPNPFNPETKITYRISSSGSVKLAIFDITGREIAVPVDESVRAGEYSVTFNSLGLASGVYFYRLDVSSDKGNFSQTKKMMIIK